MDGQCADSVPRNLARGFIYNGAFYVRTTFMVVASDAGSEVDSVAFRWNPIRLAIAEDLKRAQTRSP